MEQSKYDISALLETAEKVATVAGKLARDKLTQPFRLRSKGFRDIVTDVDLEAQQLITNMVEKRFPSHGFMTEEDDDDLPSTGPVIWIIDPIDGTTNYSRQIPEFSVSVAAASMGSDDSRLLAAAIFDPMRQELFSGALGMGSRVNGRQMRVSDLDDTNGSLIGLDWSHSDEMRQLTLNTLESFAHQVNTIRAIGSAALALAWVAAGRLDAYLNYNLKTWDVAAGALLIGEAGGRLTDFDDTPWHWQKHAGRCIASNGRIHGALLSRISGVLS